MISNYVLKLSTLTAGSNFKITIEFFVPFCVFRRPPLNLELCRSLALNYNCWVDYNLQARVGRMCCPF